VTLSTSTLAERIRTARTLAGLSQLQLASVAGLGLQTVFRLENGRAEPRPGTMAAVAKAVGVTTLWLASGTGPGPTDTTTQA